MRPLPSQALKDSMQQTGQAGSGQKKQIQITLQEMEGQQAGDRCGRVAT
jgi:hypothetical protein